MKPHPTLFDIEPLGISQYGTPIKRREEPARDRVEAEPKLAQPPIVRPSDPETSHDAAEKVQLERCQLIFLRSLYRCQPASAYEIAARQSEWLNNDTIRKRAGGLKKLGMIRVIDRNATHPQTGRSVERFMLTGAGIQRIQTAD